MPSIKVKGTIPSEGFDNFEVYQLYNCLDAAITAQLVPAMAKNFTPNTLYTYRREMELQSLCLEMSSKGFPINQMELANLLFILDNQERRALYILHTCCEAVGYGPINPNSPDQIAHFFYSYLNLPTIYAYDKKTRKQKVSTDIKALEQLRDTYSIAAPFVNAIAYAKESRKMASVFKRGLEPGTNLLRCNVTPSGTDSGRLSSQQNPYNRGTNAQNLTNKVRRVIEAPDGYVILNFDLKTAESLAVGYIAKDLAYIEACTSGDVHTSVAKTNWPNLGWTGNLKLDKDIAEQPYYRQWTYRDMAKRGGHATNYYGQPPTVAKNLNLPRKVVEEFQRGYFAGFPGIPKWHLSTIATIQQEGILVNAMRRERVFWGRPNDTATWRAAIAHNPQSLVADVMNEGLVIVQRYIKEHWQDKVSLLMQVHDAGVFLCPISMVAEVTAKIKELLRVPVDFGELGTMIIESDCSAGKRWYKDKKDPLALRDHKPGTPFVQ